MRIIGGHDYYDSALAYGSDNDVVFVREKTNEMQHKLVKVREISAIDICVTTEQGQTYDLTVKYAHLKFYFTLCSVIVGGSRWNGVRWNMQDTNGGSSTKYIWDWKSFLQILAQEKLSLISRKKFSRWSSKSDITENYFGETACSQDEINWLVERNITILTCDYHLPNYTSHRSKNVWKCNQDNLKDMEFYRSLDAFSVFQRISQWVGGILSSTGNSMVQITDDKVKAHKHGFDKWSFRKQPVNIVDNSQKK